MQFSKNFWEALEGLVAANGMVIDRAAHTAHPRFTDKIYPLDYGYIPGTSSGDGEGIDAWRGSLPEPTLAAIVCTVDQVKRDTEIKLLLGCTPQECAQVLAFHNDGFQSAILVERP